MGKFGNVPSN